MAGKHNLPTFPLIANIWHTGSILTGPPDVIVQAQLHVGVQHRQIAGLSAPDQGLITRFIYLPKATDVRPIWAGGADIIECPAGSSHFYLVDDVDDVAKGFLNEFRVACVVATILTPGRTPWPVPFT
jgi:hypothetical protein